jgi:branched-chain amino acid aminotransferase
MAFEDVKKIWMNGKMVDFADATVHVFTHVIHYGSGVFEGIRSYDTAKGAAVFRMREHYERFFASAKIYRMEIPWTIDQLMEASLETIRANEFDACYIRPVCYRGYASLGVNPFPCPVDVFIGVWKWGKYLGPEAVEQGVDVCVSSWNRMAPNTFPAMAKTCANYANSQLIKMEAIKNGYVEGIALDTAGYVCEGSGENIFVVWRGKITTPPLGASVLPGITRDSVIRIARDLGLEVVEGPVPREMLYIADEVFFTGTAAEITPIRSIDKIPVGAGKRGPVAERLQKELFAILTGQAEDRYGWLTPVGAPVAPAKR